MHILQIHNSYIPNGFKMRYIFSIMILTGDKWKTNNNNKKTPNNSNKNNIWKRRRNQPETNEKKIVCKFVETKTYDQRETIGIVWFTSFKGCCSLLHSKNNQRKANGVHCIKISERLCVVWLMIFDMFWQKKYVGIVSVAARMGWLLFKCWLLFSLPSKSGCSSFWLVGCVGGFFSLGGSFIFADPITFFYCQFFSVALTIFFIILCWIFPLLRLDVFRYFVKYNIEVYRFGNGNVHP